ncbi:hypothetical protein EP331_10335 [bacterium]|nr:MAG: hypothetical protein EP331_10335 [bacterium]
MLGFIYFILFTALISCKKDEPQVDPEFFQLLRVKIDGTSISTSQAANGISVSPIISIEFSAAVDTQIAKTAVKVLLDGSATEAELAFSFPDNQKTIEVTPIQPLSYLSSYQLVLSESLKGDDNQTFPGLTYNFETERGVFELVSATINGSNFYLSSAQKNIPYNDVELVLTFSEPLDPNTYQSALFINPSINPQYQLSADNKTLTISNGSDMDYYRFHTVSITSNLVSSTNFEFEGFSKSFQTGLNPTTKMPQLSDDALLDLVQSQTFKYFWDYAHPTSGLARERLNSGETVTIGGSGFGLMAILVGIHRNFITRQQGVERLQKIATFLKNADRFHGVWPHWMNGSTGTTIAFSTNDNGADLVETAFMAEGLITVREFLDANDSAEQTLISDINYLMDTIEWNWFTRDGQNVLYWHWSPDKGWAMNMQIKGYNEALIVYVLAASSKNYAIDKSVYTSGWASNGGIVNNKTFYGHTLPVGFDYGGPLFFAHYSFLGLDPRNLSDTYANYWEQNQAHSLINYEHNVRNPSNYLGYSDESWGLTASDDHKGYGVHEPTRDNGTISPTAALSSFPYTPTESMKALKHFYYVLGDKLWGNYGFYDAFNPSQAWWASSFLAIDQGPIIVMIENHRSGLLWDNFMKAPEVQTALENLGFTVSN